MKETANLYISLKNLDYQNLIFLNQLTILPENKDNELKENKKLQSIEKIEIKTETAKMKK